MLAQWLKNVRIDLEPLSLALLCCIHQCILLLEREIHATQLFLLNRLRVRILNLKKNQKKQMNG